MGESKTVLGLLLWASLVSGIYPFSNPSCYPSPKRLPKPWWTPCCQAAGLLPNFFSCLWANIGKLRGREACRIWVHLSELFFSPGFLSLRPCCLISSLTLTSRESLKTFYFMNITFVMKC